MRLLRWIWDYMAREIKKQKEWVERDEKYQRDREEHGWPPQMRP